MHILVTNDDGPPSPQSSPYVLSLVRHLQAAGHTVSVCLPHTQRSWIGKAHMIGQTLHPTYYRPSSTHTHGEEANGTTHARPSTSSEQNESEEWILIDGTPASCVQIGLHHFFQDRGPIDLVLSGPNYGRNTTAVFALSSGTLGASLEAAVCQAKTIALSFAFFSRNHDPVIIDGACRHSVRLIEALHKQWPSDGSVDVYSVNVPLVEGVESHKSVWTSMLQNYWTRGSCFQEIEGVDGSPEGAAEEEAKIREGKGGEMDGKEVQDTKTRGHKHKHFKWAPRFADVYQSVEDAGPGNDGWAVKEGCTSITPIKANYAKGAGGAEGEEFKFPDDIASTQMKTSHDGSRPQTGTALEVMVSYDDPYVQPLITAALKAVLPQGSYKIFDEPPSRDGTGPNSQLRSTSEPPTLQIVSYESIDFDRASSHPQNFLINSYMIRKALIRKHYLSTTVDHWVAKHPTSILKEHFKRSEAFEVDYAEFLDDALVEAFDLRESLDRNATLLQLPNSEPKEREYWILKPGMSDRGQGIKLFSTMEELQAIFDRWEEDQPDTDEEEEDVDNCGEREAAPEDTSAGGEPQVSREYITTSHLRHFVAQPYIHPPLLVPGDDRKFHIRTYVLCVGSITVYVYEQMLALFAAKSYTAPWEAPDDIESFLTNTCLQASPNENTVRSFWDLDLASCEAPGDGGDGKKQGSSISHDSIFGQICEITGEVFEAAARAMPIHFQPLPNAFEVFGLDFMVDARGQVYLLEVNAFPDFKQTGDELQGVVAGFWEEVVRQGVAPFFQIAVAPRGDDDHDSGDRGGRRGMVKVREVDLGRR